jgi:hypothetical protein
MTLTKDVPLIADMSVAPEIARLAEAVLLVPAQGSTPAAAPPVSGLTLGTLARQLRSIAASPERWWALVRFEPSHPVQITVAECAAYRAWLVVLPPADAGQACDCDMVTMIAGEAAEGTPGGPVLRPGPVRVHGERNGERRGERHGERHWLHGRGAGYSISLHARAYRVPITAG